MRIVFDTSAVFTDLHLSGDTLKLIKGGLPRIGATLVVPAVVVDEMKGKFADELREAAEKAKKPVEKLADLLDRSVDDLVSQEALSTAVEQYAERLPGVLERAGIEVLPYPDVSHEAVVAVLQLRRRPFKATGGKEVGYRDYLIWRTIIDLLKAGTDEVAFVYQNLSDFGLNGQLFPDLLGDLEAEGIDNRRVRVFTSLTDLYDRLIAPSLETLDGLADDLRGPEWQEGIREQFDADGVRLVDWALEQEGLTDRPRFLREMQLLSARAVDALEIEKVQRLSNGKVVVSGRVAVELEFDVWVPETSLGAAEDWLGHLSVLEEAQERGGEIQAFGTATVETEVILLGADGEAGSFGVIVTRVSFR